jgi:high affinity Mn2+ porin
LIPLDDMPRTLSWTLAATLSLCLAAAAAHAQQQPLNLSPQDATPEAPSPQLTVFPHSDTTRWLIAGQANIIFQAHPGFHSPYEGPNSLLSRGEYKVSLLGTLYSGFQLNPHPGTRPKPSSILNPPADAASPRP